MKEIVQMIEQDYKITCRTITTWNPQANSILERTHQTIGNILRTFQVNNHELEQDNPWNRILFVVIFPMRSTVHTTTQAMPMQLVFGCDAIMNLTFDANCHLIRQRKHNLMNQSNSKKIASKLNLPTSLMT